MDDRDLQMIQTNIEKKRLEIEKEIEEKKKKLEMELVAHRKAMEEKLSAQRAEMDRHHREQIQLMQRQVNARELAAKIEAEFLAGKEKVEAKVRTESTPFFLSGQTVEKKVLKEIPEVKVEPDVKTESSGKSDILEFFKGVFHKETPEEIAEDIAKKDAEKLALEEKKRVETEERLRRKKEQEEHRKAKVALQEKEKQERNIRNSFFRKKDYETGEALPLDKPQEALPAEDKGTMKRDNSLWIRIVLFSIAALFLALVFFFGTVFVMRHFVGVNDVGTVYPRTKISNESGEIIEGILPERINVLILGTDYGDSEAGRDEPKRTDAMLLLSVDPVKNRVSVLSIPRDTKVILSGHRDPQKINAAYAFGGVMLAKQAVANLLGVPVTHYALADWQAFSKIVDIIGGVDILVEHDMKYDDPYANLHIDIKKGYQHLDGKLAAQYVRYRSDELGDIGRAQRQQLFVRSAVKQMLKVGNIVKIPSILKTISDYVETDMTLVTMLKVADSVQVFGNRDIKTGTLGGENSDEDGVSYWLTDDAAVKRTLMELNIPSSKLR